MKKYFKSILVVLTLMLSSQVFALTALFRWLPSTEREDNSPLTGLLKYNIYMGTSSGSYTVNSEILLPVADGAYLTNTRDLPFAEDATTYAVLTTVDDAGRESKYSMEVIVKGKIKLQGPGTPEILASYALFDFSEQEFLEDNDGNIVLPNDIFRFLETRHPELTTGDLIITTSLY